MKKILIALAALSLATVATVAGAAERATSADTGVHRYLIERTFPAGALAGLDAATKARVNANNDAVGVRWIESYANADQTKTYCVYEGPSEAAIREASRLNKLPVDNVIEVPVTLLPR
ncbi:MAG: hypothetical protein RL030_469 [Pseudomonadota bacterium]|jgi:hypothetical protein